MPLEEPTEKTFEEKIVGDLEVVKQELKEIKEKTEAQIG